MGNEGNTRKQKISMLLTLKNIQELKDYLSRGLFPVFNTRFQKRDFKKKAKMFITTNKGMLMREVNGLFLMAVANNDLERIHSICRYAHDDSEHCKSEDSWKKIRSHWMGFRKQHIIDWVAKCRVCTAANQINENTILKDTKPQHRMAFTSFSMERLQIDCINMSSHSLHNNGFSYIIHCMDLHTSYHFAFPLQKKDSHELCECLISLLGKEGWPHIIQTDFDSVFLSDELSVLFATNKVIHVYSNNDCSPSINIIKKTRSVFKKKLVSRMKLKKCLYNWTSVLSDVLSDWNSEFSSSVMNKPINIFRTHPPNIEKYMCPPPDDDLLSS
ncbi:hypothetical protein NEIG_00151 [Nematocida sp. ERTm5]|nr:hypothetical protein NEIG_00151 [Nematocida sp. ERTm5]